MKWETVKLSDCCLSIADGDHQPPPKAEAGVHFVTISNINANHQFDFTDTMFVPREYYDKLDSKRKAQIGDVLYSVVGSFGIPVLIKENTPFVFQRHIAILRPNDKILPTFLYYTMLSSDFYAKADAAAIGAAQRTVSLNALRNMEIALPPIEVQDRITNKLTAYDDLIENNQKQIKLLEEAAQRLYKEWFIDLLSPDMRQRLFMTVYQRDGRSNGLLILRTYNTGSHLMVHFLIPRGKVCRSFVLGTSQTE